MYPAKIATFTVVSSLNVKKWTCHLGQGSCCLWLEIYFRGSINILVTTFIITVSRTVISIKKTSDQISKRRGVVILGTGGADSWLFLRQSLRLELLRETWYHFDSGCHLLVPQLASLPDDDPLLALLPEGVPAGVTMPHWIRYIFHSSTLSMNTLHKA